MKIEYDGERDLFYIYFTKPGAKVAKTVTITPGVFADFDEQDKIIGLEIIDASEYIDKKIEFDLSQFKKIA